MKSKQILAFIFFLSLQSHSLTLQEATQMAQDNSHEIKEFRLEAESAQWNELKTLSGYLPKVDVGARHLFHDQFEEIELPFGGDVVHMPAVQPYTSLTLNATINVFKGFGTFNEVRAADQAKIAAENRLKHAEEQKRIDTQTLFYRALGSQILVEVANQTIETLDSHLKDINSRIRNGVSTRYDGLRIDVQLEEAKTEKIQAENNVAIARAKLFEALGRADDGNPLVGKVPEDFSRVDVSKLSIENVERTDRLALIAEGERAEKHAAASKAHWLPSVDLFGEYEWYNNINHSIEESDRRFKNAYAVGVSLNWNLFDGGASYAAQRQAALERGIADERLAQFEQNVPVVFEEAKRHYTYNATNYTAKLGSIRKAEEAVRLAKSGLKAGIYTNTEVLDSVVELNRAKASAVKSQIDAVEALGQLELSVGHAL